MGTNEANFPKKSPGWFIMMGNLVRSEEEIKCVHHSPGSERGQRKKPKIISHFLDWMDLLNKAVGPLAAVLGLGWWLPYLWDPFGTLLREKNLCSGSALGWSLSLKVDVWFTWGVTGSLHGGCMSCTRLGFSAACAAQGLLSLLRHWSTFPGCCSVQNPWESSLQASPKGQLWGQCFHEDNALKRWVEGASTWVGVAESRKWRCWFAEWWHWQPEIPRVWVFGYTGFPEANLCLLRACGL